MKKIWWLSHQEPNDLSTNGPLKRFAEVGRYFHNQGYYSLILAGKDDEDICQAMISKMEGSGLNLAGKFSLIETAEILKKMPTISVQ